MRQRRDTAALCAGTAMMNAAMAVTSATGTLVATDHLGPARGGLPVTAGIVGTGVGALLVGRRRGLPLGYLAATAGAALAVWATARHDVPALCLGMLLLGLGNASAQLSRYAVAGLHPPHRRGFAIGLVVWAATVGAVGGPLLLSPSGELAESAGLSAHTGPFLLAAAVCAVAAAAVATAATGGPERPPAPRPRDLTRSPAARSAFVTMATAQVVMVAVMTAVPLQMHLHGHGLAPIGTVLSAHTLGMFALSPLTGRLTDRYGADRVAAAGLATLLAASALAGAGPGGAPFQAAAMFLLGYGWNLCFIGGSTRLARDLPAAGRASLEGAVDAAVWGLAAVASLACTAVLAFGGFRLLAVAAGLLATAPLVTRLGRRWSPRGR
ncbi:MFS transporter [Actinomadura namibiensis]|uniref:MFS family permease n=1 Tax=Actinomadura namibiensis TaxID=182080 RepID=A0A7W3LZB3_ACTNM|nr:MFS transporter [Actinomadura namibiensis]MBA8957106.1 MFS family permease [Actinomadura namibiensis]